MSAVQIAGCSGAGKTSIAAVLARRGLAVIDADDDPLLARSVDAAGHVAEEPEEPDLAWLSQHGWAWDPARLDELLPELQERLRASGAIPIDARQPLDQVADAILAHRALGVPACPAGRNELREDVRAARRMVCTATGKPLPVTTIDNRTIRGMTAGAAGSTTRPATLARAAALGAATGSRSTAGITALALTSRRTDRGVIAARAGSRPGQIVTPLIAAGELTADKLPFVPSRLGAPGIIPRIALAAVAAAGMAMRDGERPEPAAAVAAVTALGSAALGVRFRAFAARRLGSDLPGAFTEDTLAATLAWLGARRR